MIAAPAAADAVPALDFRVLGVEAQEFAAVPTLALALEVVRTGGGPVRAVSLSAAVRIDPARREHPPDAHSALAELFGLPREWARSMRPLPWTRTTAQVPAFDQRARVTLPVPCGTDEELAVTKYLRAVRGGDVPLDLLFNGTVFYEHPGAGLMAAALPATAQAAGELPAALWRELVGRYHQGRPWLRMPQETYDRLDAYRVRRVLGSADDALRDLLDRSGAP